MRFGIEIVSRIADPSGMHEHDRDGWIAHFNALMEGLIEVGAGDPSVDADFEAGSVEIAFVVEGDSDAEAMQNALRLFIAALEASGAQVNEVSLDSMSKKELVSA